MRIPTRQLTISTLATMALAGFVSLAFAPVALGAAKQIVIYDSTVHPLRSNLPSVGAEAYSFKEFGDEVTFKGNAARMLQNVTVTLSSWACESGHWYSGDCVTTAGHTFDVPVTFNIYQVGSGDNRPGALIATVTQTFAVPYRPSADTTRCTGGKWFLSKREGCFNGLATDITFDFTSLNISLPDSVVYGISYNTTNYGPTPFGTAAACYTSSGGCFYDSLNIGLAPVVNVGSQDFPGTVYQNAVFAADYCDNGADGVGVMRLDSFSAQTCWVGLIPAVQFTASH